MRGEGGYRWAVAAGLNAALAAATAKLLVSQNRKPLQGDSVLSQFVYLSFQERRFLSLHRLRRIRILSWFHEFLKYGLILVFNIIMWGCYINSLKALSSLQATVTNFATNFLCSGLVGSLIFEETLPSQWFAGACFIVLGVIILSKSSIPKMEH